MPRRRRSETDPSSILRKLVVIDRLLARLLVVAPDRWVVKGGVALSLRLQGRARMTRDLDLTCRHRVDSTAEDMLAATEYDPADGFTLAILRAEDTSEGVRTIRYTIRAELGGRQFEDVTIDLGVGEPFLAEPDIVAGTSLLAFAGSRRSTCRRCRCRTRSRRRCMRTPVRTARVSAAPESRISSIWC